ncbi:MAG: mannan endo-1,4-beta-mannosidase [Saprospiraceae bacterium]|jgi:mannan endo-1,4-beta-mannosidase
MNWIKSFKLLKVMLLGMLFFYCGCQNSESSRMDETVRVNSLLVDSLATTETLNLFSNLKSLAKDKVLFGHQESTAYGVGWTHEGITIESDIEKVCGDFPAVYGWDIGNIGKRTNNDCIPFSHMKKLIIDAFERGGINTISSHMHNAHTDKNYGDVTPSVAHLLPGGSHYKNFIEKLDLIAAFMEGLKSEDGISIPIIFRPFHEHNGDWFWWGKGPATEEEYIQLWRFTVDYFRNEKEIHNLLYAFAPARSRMTYPLTASEYLYGYPGDEYVDVLGLDNYFDLDGIWNKAPLEEQKKSFKESLELIVKLAEEKDKIAALTETGSVNIKTKGWWTNWLLSGIEENENTKKIAYALVWRNEDKDHFHAPYPGHKEVLDFIAFFNNPTTIFNSDLSNLYGD